MYLEKKKPELIKMFLEESNLQSEKGEHKAIIAAFFDSVKQSLSIDSEKSGNFKPWLPRSDLQARIFQVKPFEVCHDSNCSIHLLCILFHDI